MSDSPRTPLIIGNWKLNPAPDDAIDLALACMQIAETAGEAVEIGIAVPFPYLPGVAAVISQSRLRLGAQDVSGHDQGAYTGEVSAAMVKQWADFAIVGHSERRQYHGETDDTVAAKARAAVGHGLTAIICVGETLDQRESGNADTVVGAQVATAIAGFTGDDCQRLVIAYEPVWAIGTGVSANPNDAAAMAETIRTALAPLGPGAAAIRVLYGGSVNAGNSVAYLEQPGIDGALVGGASLKPGEFGAISHVGH